LHGSELSFLTPREEQIKIVSKDRLLRRKCESKMEEVTEGQAVTQPVCQPVTFHVIKQQRCCEFLGYHRSAVDVFILLGQSIVPL